MEHKINFLKEYTNLKNAASLGGVHAFYKQLKSKYKNVKLKEVQNWLSSQDVYTKHKPRQTRFDRNKVYAESIDDNWQMDLCDMRSISKENDGYNYILTVIDVFSKYAWAKATKNKTKEDILEALKSIINKRKPKKIQADDGKEFFNSLCKSYMKENNIILYSTKSELKACVVERFNRTIKEKIWKYFTLKETNRYIDVLDDIIHSYNNSFHRSIKMKPINVNKGNSNIVFLNLYGMDIKTGAESFSKYKPNKTVELNVGDAVRISKYKSIFDKGYTRRWTSEIFFITKIFFNDVLTYEIKDLEGEIIVGRYYEKELQKVNFIDSKIHYKKDKSLVKILKTRKLKGKTEYFVHWKDYPDTSDSWINSIELE